MSDDGDELLAQPRRRRIAPGWYALGALVIAAGVLVAVLNRNHHDAPVPQPTPSPASSDTRPHGPPIGVPIGGLPSTAPGPVVLGGFTRPVHGNFSLYARAGNAVLRFDFAAGRLTSTAVPALQSSGPVIFLATSRGVMLRPLDNFPGYLVPDGGPVKQLGGALAEGPVLPGPDPDHVWVDDDTFGGTEIQLVDTNGRHPGRPPALPADPYGGWTSDGSGYLLVPAEGGLFDVRNDGMHLVARGLEDVIAAGADRLLATACPRGSAPDAACPGYVVSTRTGKRTALAPLQAVQEQAPGPISPDGRTAAVFVQPTPGTTGVQLTDLTTGRARHTAVPVDPDVAGGTAIGGSGGAVFSPDGRWLFLITAEDSVVAVDVATGTVHGLGIPLPNVLQLALRAG